MKNVLRGCGLIVLGGLLGVVGATTMSGQAQLQRPADRLRFIDLGQNSSKSSLVFIADSKSGGCWIGVDTKGDGITAVAAAPEGACRQ